nr:reverse transcriptase domain-containing protein [Tanacetum cinerariifolium]
MQKQLWSPTILAEHFELKHSLINMMTSDQFFGLEKDNPHDHNRWFNKITSTIKYKDVPNSAIKLMPFPFSHTEAACRWLEKEPSHSILTWEDLVSKFINEFFPPQEQQISVMKSPISTTSNRFKNDLPFKPRWGNDPGKLRATPDLLISHNSSPRPPKKIVSDNSNAAIESFSPSPVPNKDSDPHMEEIDLSFNPDDPMPPGIEYDDYDSGRDIPILEKLLDNYSLSLPDNESYHFDIPLPYRPPAKPPDGKTGTLNIKMMGDVFDQKIHIPNLTITRIFNQEKSPYLLSHLGFKAFQPSAKCPMLINGKNTPVLDVPLFYFYPP